ncbi:hypothetical protein PtA15_11A425 [Puccinia triticina]|uniref:TPR-like protein n=1 Tax=Puccinia triticina TaxID=208348 RepID=A0ABY7CWQ7_9BASI|nr:uncharacterized protein PtA15_11A425 [Puccinia triticina]WAQ89734.1 hypothetical protein PtA15_11A425 [Puccinia triticina]WAR59782.1 hypothetical protein PtB15_11B423 [Puccinia triticina]
MPHNDLDIINNRFEELPEDPKPAQSSAQGDSKESVDEELDPLDKVLLEANSLKELGNTEFQKQRWHTALGIYSEALAALPLRPLPKPSPKPGSNPHRDEFSDNEDDANDKKDPHPETLDHDSEPGSSIPASLQSSNDPRISRLRSILNANTAACYLKSEDWQSAVQAADASLKDDPNYAKALHRRAQANEKLGTWASLQSSLDDYNAISKLPEVPPGLLKEVKASQTRLPPLIAQRSEADKAEMMAKLKDLGNTVLGKFGMSTDNFKFTPNESGGYSMSFQQ